MSLSKKIDFVLFVSATNANPNGDPLEGNHPRTDFNGYGEISDVCIKRKIRNRMQDLGNSIFVQSQDRADDGNDSLAKRAKCIGKTDDPNYAANACKKWLDVRSFGQVFAFKDKSKKGKGKGKSETSESESDDQKGVSIGIRGPVSVHQAVSISPVDVISMQITKSVNGESGAERSSDTMGQKHFVRFGLYKIMGSINVQLAEKTGFSEEDAQIIKECLRTLFINDSSSARPDGSMEVVKLFWWEHNCKNGQYSTAKVHRSVQAKLKENVNFPSSVDDYDIVVVDELPDLKLEVIDGI